MWPTIALFGIQIPCITIFLLFHVLVCAFYLPVASASDADVAKHQPVYQCPYPDSPDTEQHQKFINGLNGTRIVFIGDSLSRCCVFGLVYLCSTTAACHAPCKLPVCCST